MFDILDNLERAGFEANETFYGIISTFTHVFILHNNSVNYSIYFNLMLPRFVYTHINTNHIDYSIEWNLHDML